MKLHVLSDDQGNIVATTPVIESGPIRSGFNVTTKQFVHQVEVPATLKGRSPREITSKLVIKNIGDSPIFVLG
ncbi:MAG TPA: hypothetical protein PK231_09020 [Acidocella sp.]|nr:MAG: hypothetical protein B7Z77_05810 [Acidocella sp. 20-58-15]OYY04238.1 MAG: hypothetical protein B7Y73_04720 [Acidocella sp. 35-58-6]HQT39555.1 hypothetical protein [Acidocella sp.]